MVGYYRKVGGWLLLFCISISIISPVLILLFVRGRFLAMSSLFDEYPMLKTYLIGDTILIIALAAFGIYTAILLWKLDSDGVSFAKIYLVVGIIYSSISIFLPYITGLPEERLNTFFEGNIISSIRQIFVAAIWFGYFVKSKRVKETYNL